MAIAIDDITILEKAKSGTHRGFDHWDDSTCQHISAQGENPFCGDELEIRLALKPDEHGTLYVTKAAYDGYGCTLCLAATEAVTQHIEGLPIAQVSLLTFEDTCELLGGLSVGRTRKGCVELAVRIISRALSPMLK